jgi:hypothetical protein
LVDCRAKPVSAFRDSVVGNSTRHQVKRYQAAWVIAPLQGAIK